VSRRQPHLLARDVEGAQVQQLGVGRGGDDAEAPQAVGRLAAVDGSMVPRSVISWNSSNRLSACAGVVQRADRQHQHAHGLAGRSRLGAPAPPRRGSRWHGRLRRAAAAAHLPSTSARMTASSAAVSIGPAPLPWWRASCAFSASPDCSSTSTISGVGVQLVAAQLVQQRLHLVRQLGHVGEAEGRRAALDRVRAAEDGVELLVVGGLDVQRQQHALHVVEVLAGFLEEDLEELAQVDAGARLAALLCRSRPWRCSWRLCWTGGIDRRVSG
jgi:hypothetical protein